MKVLAFNPDLCDGARGCEIACAETWFHVAAPHKSSIRIQALEDGFGAEFCIQCGACVPVCPVNALVQVKNGVVHLRKQSCVGCMACVGFCPYEVMHYDTDQAIAFKCVACGQCVQACPTGALAIIEADDVSTDLWNGREWRHLQENI